MRVITRGCKRWLAAAALVVIGMTANRSYAATTSYLNIEVTINQSLAVQVNYLDVGSTQNWANNWSATHSSETSTSSATVTNNSGGLIERWMLSTYAKSNPTGTAVQWSISATTNSASLGTDKFALLAQFIPQGGGTGCPALWDTSWTVSTMSIVGSGVPQFYGQPFDGTRYWYTSAQGSSGPDVTATFQMDPVSMGGTYGQRGLCWKLMGPPATTVSGSNVNETVQLVVTASN